MKTYIVNVFFKKISVAMFFTVFCYLSRNFLYVKCYIEILTELNVCYLVNCRQVEMLKQLKAHRTDGSKLYMQQRTEDLADYKWKQQRISSLRKWQLSTLLSHTYCKHCCTINNLGDIIAFVCCSRRLRFYKYLKQILNVNFFKLW